MNIAINKQDNKYTVTVNGQEFTSAKPAYIVWKFRQITGVKKTFEEIVGSATDTNVEQLNVNDEFSINERFGFVESVVGMVAGGIQASAVITGEGGLGKTFTVLKTLSESGLTDLTNPDEIGGSKKKSFIQIKGFSTAKNLYRTLYDNNDAVIVFDDCDSILKCPVSVNILKGALDSYDRRIITWGAESRGDDDLPKSFEFTGRIIFISNLDQNKIDQAIRSRSMLIDLSMTLAQKIERMGSLVMQPDFMPEYSDVEKIDALKFIDTNKESAREISLRTLITVAKIRGTNQSNWEGLAKYVLCN